MKSNELFVGYLLPQNEPRHTIMRGPISKVIDLLVDKDPKEARKLYLPLLFYRYLFFLPKSKRQQMLSAYIRSKAARAYNLSFNTLVR